MPYGGDPIRELGPDLLKGCGLLIAWAVIAMIAVGFVVGKAL